MAAWSRFCVAAALAVSVYYGIALKRRGQTLTSVGVFLLTSSFGRACLSLLMEWRAWCSGGVANNDLVVVHSIGASGSSPRPPTPQLSPLSVSQLHPGPAGRCRLAPLLIPSPPVFPTSRTLLQLRLLGFGRLLPPGCVFVMTHHWTTRRPALARVNPAPSAVAAELPDPPVPHAGHPRPGPSASSDAVPTPALGPAGCPPPCPAV